MPIITFYSYSIAINGRMEIHSHISYLLTISFLHILSCHISMFCVIFLWYSKYICSEIPSFLSLHIYVIILLPSHANIISWARRQLQLLLCVCEQITLILICFIFITTFGVNTDAVFWKITAKTKLLIKFT